MLIHRQRGPYSHFQPAFALLWLLCSLFGAGAVSAQDVAGTQDALQVRIDSLRWTRTLLPGVLWTVREPIGVELRLQQADVELQPVPPGYTLALVGTRTVPNIGLPPQEGIYRVSLTPANAESTVWRAEAVLPLYGDWRFSLEEPEGIDYLQIDSEDTLRLSVVLRLRLTHLPEEGPSQGIFLGEEPIPSGPARPRGRDYSQYPLRPHSGGLRFRFSMEDFLGIPTAAESDVMFGRDFGVFNVVDRVDFPTQNAGRIIQNEPSTSYFITEFLIPRGETEAEFSLLAGPASCPQGSSICSVEDVLDARGANTAVVGLGSLGGFGTDGNELSDGTGTAGPGVVYINIPRYNGYFVRVDGSSAEASFLVSASDIVAGQSLELTISAEGQLNFIPNFPSGNVQNAYVDLMRSYNGGRPMRVGRLNLANLFDPFTPDSVVRTIVENLSIAGEYRYTLQEPVEQNDIVTNEQSFSQTVRVRSASMPQVMLNSDRGTFRRTEAVEMFLNTILPGSAGTTTAADLINLEVVAIPMDEETLQRQAELSGNFRNALEQISLYFDSSSDICLFEEADINCESALYSIRGVGVAASPDHQVAVFTERSFSLWDLDVETGILTRESIVRHPGLYVGLSTEPNGNFFSLETRESESRITNIFAIEDGTNALFAVWNVLRTRFSSDIRQYRGNVVYDQSGSDFIISSMLTGNYYYLAFHGRIEETGETNTWVSVALTSRGRSDTILVYSENVSANTTVPSETAAFLPSYTGEILYAYHPSHFLLFALQQDGDFLSMYTLSEVPLPVQDIFSTAPAQNRVISKTPAASYCSTNFLREYPQPLPYQTCEEVTGLDDVSALAASPDGRWLYTLSKGERALGVWSVDVDNNTLSQRALYMEGAGSCAENAADCFDGFDRVGLNAIEVFENRVITVSDNRLHLWEAAPDGALRLLAYYLGGDAACPATAENCTEGVQGLSGIQDIAFSDRGADKLLYVAATNIDSVSNVFFSDHALSVWRLNEPSSVFVSRSLTLPAGYTFGQAEETILFEADTLAPGAWRFQVRERGDEEVPRLDTFGAENTVTVIPVPTVSLATESLLVAVGSTLTVTLSLDSLLMAGGDIRTVIVEVIAEYGDSSISRLEVFDGSSEMRRQLVRHIVFPTTRAGVIRIRAVEAAGAGLLRIPPGTELTVQVEELPFVDIAVAPVVTEGELISVRLSLSEPLAEAVRIELTASRGGTRRIVRMAQLPTSPSLSLSIPFCTVQALPSPQCPGQGDTPDQDENLREGTWIFQLSSTDAEPGTLRLSEKEIPVRVQSLPRISIMPPAPQAGEAFAVQVQSDRPLTRDVTGLAVRAVRKGVTLESSTRMLQAGGELSQSFQMPVISTPGIWVFSLEERADFSGNVILSASSLSVRVAVPDRIRAEAFTVSKNSEGVMFTDATGARDLLGPLDLEVRLSTTDLQAHPSSPTQPFPPGYAVEVLALSQPFVFGEPLRVRLTPEPGLQLWRGTVNLPYPATWIFRVVEPGDADYLAGEDDLVSDRMLLAARLVLELLTEGGSPVRIPHGIPIRLSLTDSRGEGVFFAASMDIQVAYVLDDVSSANAFTIPGDFVIPVGSTSVEGITFPLESAGFLQTEGIEDFLSRNKVIEGIAGFSRVFVGGGNVSNFIVNIAPEEALLFTREGISIDRFAVLGRGENIPGVESPLLLSENLSAGVRVSALIDPVGYLFADSAPVLNVMGSCNGSPPEPVLSLSIAAVSALSPESLVLTGSPEYRLPFLLGTCVYTLEEPEGQENIIDGEEEFFHSQNVVWSALTAFANEGGVGISDQQQRDDIFVGALSQEVPAEVVVVTLTVEPRGREQNPGEDPLLPSSYDFGQSVSTGGKVESTFTIRIVAPDGTVNPPNAFAILDDSGMPTTQYELTRGAQVFLNIRQSGVWVITFPEISIGSRTIPASESTGENNPNPLLAFSETSFYDLVLIKGTLEVITSTITITPLYLPVIDSGSRYVSVGTPLPVSVALDPPRVVRSDIRVLIRRVVAGEDVVRFEEDINLRIDVSSVTVTQATEVAGRYEFLANPLGGTPKVIDSEILRVEVVRPALLLRNPVTTGADSLQVGVVSYLFPRISPPLGPGIEVAVTVVAERTEIADAIDIERRETVVLGPGNTDATVIFNGLAPGEWALRASVAEEDTPFLDISGARGLVTLDAPRLEIALPEGSNNLAFPGQRKTLLVSASFAPTIPVQVELQGQLDGSSLGRVRLNPARAFQNVPANIIVGGEVGQTWTVIGALLEDTGLLNVSGASVTFAVEQGAEIRLTLVPPGEDFLTRTGFPEDLLLGSELQLALYTFPAISFHTEAMVEVTAPDASTRAWTICLSQGAVEDFSGTLACPQEAGIFSWVSVPFMPTTTGTWTFAARSVQRQPELEGVIIDVLMDSTRTNVQLPKLLLLDISPREDVEVLVPVSVEGPPLTTVTATVQAVRRGTGETVTADVQLAPEAYEQVPAVFSGSSRLTEGTYDLEVLAVVPMGIADLPASTATVTVRESLPVVTISGVSEEVAAGTTLMATITLTKQPERDVDAAVTIRHIETGVLLTSTLAFRLAGPTSQVISFGTKGLPGGDYELFVRAGTEDVLDTRLARAAFSLLPSLSLFLPEAARRRDQMFEVLLSSDARLSTTVRITVNAQARRSGMTMSALAELGPNAYQGVVATFAPYMLEEGVHDLSVTAFPPGIVEVADAVAELTVEQGALTVALEETSRSSFFAGEMLALRAIPMERNIPVALNVEIFVFLIRPDSSSETLRLGPDGADGPYTSRLLLDMAGIWRFSILRTDSVRTVLVSDTTLMVTVVPAIQFSFTGTAADDNRDLLGRDVIVRLTHTEALYDATVVLRAVMAAEDGVREGTERLLTAQLSLQSFGDFTFPADSFVYTEMLGRQVPLGPGEWIFTAGGTRDSPFADLRLTMERPALVLRPEEEEVAWGSEVRLRVESQLRDELVAPAHNDAMVTVTGQRGGGPLVGINGDTVPSSQAVSQLYGEGLSTSLSTSFNYGELSPGIWEFTADTDSSSLPGVFDLSASTTVTVLPGSLVLQLVQNEGELVRALTVLTGQMVSILLSATPVPAVSVQAVVHAIHVDSNTAIELGQVTLTQQNATRVLTFDTNSQLGLYRLEVVSTTPPGVAIFAREQAPAVSVFDPLNPPLPQLTLSPSRAFAGELIEVLVSAEAVLSSSVSVTLQATRSTEAVVTSSAAELGPNRYQDVSAVFAAGALTEGVYSLSVTVFPPGVVGTDVAGAALTVMPRRSVISLSPVAQTLLTGSTATVSISLDQALTQPIRIVVTADLVSTSTTVMEIVSLPASATSGTAVFDSGRLSVGNWLLSATVETATSLARGEGSAAVQVLSAPLALSLESSRELILSGGRVTLTAALTGEERLITEVNVTLAVTPPGGAAESRQLQIGANQVSGSANYQLNEIGEWQFEVAGLEPDVLVRGASDTVVVLPPVMLSLEGTAGDDGRELLGRDVVVRLSTTEFPQLTDPVELRVSITAVAFDESSSELATLRTEGLLLADNLVTTATFLADGFIRRQEGESSVLLPSPLEWIFRGEFEGQGISTMALTMERPSLVLSATEREIPWGGDARLLVESRLRDELAAPVHNGDLVAVTGRRESGPLIGFGGDMAAASRVLSQMYGENIGTLLSTSFVYEGLSPGIWEFTADTASSSLQDVFDLSASTTVTVRPGTLVLRLLQDGIEQGEGTLPAGSAAVVRVSVEPAPAVSVQVRVHAINRMSNLVEELEGASAVLSPATPVQTIEFLVNLNPDIYLLVATSSPAEVVTFNERDDFLLLNVFDEDRPPLNLEPPAAAFAGEDVAVLVSAEAVLSSSVSVTLQARRGIEEVATSSAAELGPNRYQGVSAVFAAGALTEGVYSLSVIATPPGVVDTDASAILTVMPRRSVISLSPVAQTLLTGSTARVSISLDQALTQPIRVVVTADLASTSPTVMEIVSLPAFATSGAAVFGSGRLSVGTWLLSATVETAISLARGEGSAAVQVLSTPLALSLESSPGLILSEGRVTLTAALTGEERVITEVNVTLAVTPPGGAAETRQLQIGANQVSGSASYQLNEIGEWQFEVTGLEPDVLVRGASDTVVVLPPVMLSLEGTAGDDGRELLGRDVVVRLSTTEFPQLTDPVELRVSITAVAFDESSSELATLRTEGVLLADSLVTTVTFLADGFIRRQEGESSVLLPSPLEWIFRGEFGGQDISTMALTMERPSLVLSATEREIPWGGDARLLVESRLRDDLVAPVHNGDLVAVTGRRESGPLIGFGDDATPSESQMMSQVYGENIGTSFSISFRYEDLSPGTWEFTADTASSSLQDVFDLSASARVTVLPVPLDLRLLGAAADGVAAGRSTVRVQMSASPAPAVSVRLSLNAFHVESSRTLSDLAEVVLLPTASTQVASFMALDVGPGSYILSATSTPAGIVNASVTTVALTIERPRPLLTMSPQAQAVLAGSPVTVMLSIEDLLFPVLVPVGVTVEAVLAGASTTSRTISTTLTQGVLSGEVVFEGEDSLSEGHWVLSASVTPDLLDIDAPVAVQVLAELVALDLVAEVRERGEVALTVNLGTTVNITAAFTITVTGPDSNLDTVSAEADAGAESASVSYVASAAGAWRFEITAAPVVFTTGSAAEVVVRPFLTLTLEDTAADGMELLGRAVRMRLSAMPPLRTGPLQVTVLVSSPLVEPAAVRRERIVFSPALSSGSISFAAGRFLYMDGIDTGILGPVDWLFTGREPSGTLVFSSAALRLSMEWPEWSLIPEAAAIAGNTSVRLRGEARLRGDLTGPAHPGRALLVRGSRAGMPLVGINGDIPAIGEAVSGVIIGENRRTTSAHTFDFGRLSPGTWDFVTETLPDLQARMNIAAMSATTVTVLPPPLELALLEGAEDGRIPVGDEVPVQLSAEVAVSAAVMVWARRIGEETAVPVSSDILLTPSMQETVATLATGDLEPGDYELSATSTPTGVVDASGTTVLLTVWPEPPLLALSPASQAVTMGQTALFSLSAESTPITIVMVTISAVLSGNSLSVASAITELGPSRYRDVPAILMTDALEPGDYAISVAAVPEDVVNGSSATALLTVLPLPPVLSLSPSSQRLPEGSTVQLSISLVPPRGSVAVTVLATERLAGTTAMVSTTLSETVSSRTVSFAPGVLSAGEWLLTLSATGSPAIATATATVILEPRRAVLSLAPSRLRILSTESAVLEVRGDRRLPVDVEITATAIGTSGTVNAGMSRQATATLSMPEGTLPVSELVFSDLPEGIWTVTLAATPTENVDASSAVATVISGDAVSITLSAMPNPAIPGAPVTLRVMPAVPIEGRALVLSLRVIPPADSGSQASTLTRTIALGPEGGVSDSTFPPDAAGDWLIEAVEVIDLGGLNPLVADIRGSSAVLVVLATRLDFSTPSNGVDADDLVLALRYLALCASSCTDVQSLEALDLTANLIGEHNLEDLADGSLVVPDLTGDGVGNAADLALLQGWLSGVPGSILLSSDVQPLQIYLNIIRQALAPPAEE